MAKNDDILNIENLIAGYNGNIILDSISLNVYMGEICCIIGEEGSGKSTLLKAITQQIPHRGTIQYYGKILNKIPTSDMNNLGIDFISQGGNILNRFTVEEHIKLALSGKSKVEIELIWHEIESYFIQIKKLRKQIAGRLSGGERMLLSLSCLLTTDANLWILDEPTAGLAPDISGHIEAFLLKMSATRNKTILLMEHNYDFAFKVSDSIVTLKEGKLSSKYMPDVFREESFIDEKLYDSNHL
ncbi:MAG: ATP-binding cassette domain-containing protein [Bacteroidales bacterium]|nr:ATP-binding cassette domain-containing protein [Bacteroidales bacterium]